MQSDVCVRLPSELNINRLRRDYQRGIRQVQWVGGFNHIQPLVFLPVSGVPQGLQYLKADTPEGLEPVIDCFDATYLSGSYRRIQRPVDPDGVIPTVKMRRIAPLFPPEL